MAELSEAERKMILGDNYRPPDPNAPKPRRSLIGRMWAALTGAG